MSRRLLLTLFVSLACVRGTLLAASEEPAVQRGAQSSLPVEPESFDGDLRGLPPVRAWQPGEPVKLIPRRIYPRPGDPRGTLAPTLPEAAPQEPEGWHDPLLDQQGVAAADSVFGTPDLDFDAFSFNGVFPPDTNGDAGPNHYITAINGSGGSRLRIYDKSGALVGSEFSLRSLWTAGGSCASGLGDPVILYDPLASRWLFTEFASSGNHLCVYVSKTSDPVTGGFWLYDFATPNFPDYPKYTVWPDAYYVGTNEEANNVGFPAVYALDRARMLNGQDAAFQRFAVEGLAGFAFQVLQPADLDGSTAPPAGSPAVFLRSRDEEVHGGPTDGSKDVLQLYEFHVDWTTPANSTFTGPVNLDVPEFSSELCGLVSFECVPQPGTTRKLDPLREPVMWRSPYRNFGTHESIVGTYTVDVGDFSDHHAPRWFELRRAPPGTGSWTVFQQGLVAPDSTHRWMGSIAMDRVGNIALAYNVSNPATSVFPGIRYVGRQAGDAAGTMGGENTIVSGAGSQGGANRWGDYSALAVDPADDCRFWFAAEYMPTLSWRTRVASFKFDTCTSGPSLGFSAGSSITASENAAGTHTVSLLVTTPDGSALASPATVAYATNAGTASAGADYTTTTGTLTFAAGTASGTTQTIGIPILGDILDEADETFTLTLSSPTGGAALGTSAHTVAIADDDPPPAVNMANPPAVNEGDSGSVNAPFTILLSAASGREVTVQYATSNTTAVAGQDYTATSGSLTFSPGTSQATVNVPVLGDTTVEANEFFLMTISAPVNANLGTTTGATATIVNDDQQATVTPGTQTASPGQTVNAVVASGPGQARDWVALARFASPTSSFLDWKYLNGSKTPPVSGLTSATVPFTMPQATGTYEFRFFSSDTFQQLATSANIVVSVPTPTITAGANNATFGTVVQATVAGGPGNPNDWMALAQVGALDTQYLDWRYLNGLQAPPGTGLNGATVDFTVPSVGGQYEFRLFANNGFTLLARSQAVTVTFSATPLLSVDPTSLAFGTVSVDATRDLTVSVKNIGAGTLTGTIAVSGTGFSTPPAQGSNLLIGPNVAQIVTVRFAPTTADGFTGTLTLTGGGGAAVPLSGTGIVGPTVTASATSATTGQVVNAIVANGPGNATDWVALASLSTSGPTQYVDWRYLNGLQTPPGSGLTAASVPFTMPLAPDAYEFRFFASNGFTRLATSALVSVSAAPAISALPSPLAFGGVTQNTTKQLALTVRNAGTGTLSGACVVSGTGFTLVGDGSYSLASNAARDLAIAFTPTSLAGFTGTATCSGGGGATVNLTGTGVSGPSVTASTTSAVAGASVSAVVANGPGHSTDWVALAAAGADNTSYLDWRYLNGAQSPPGNGLTSASVPFVMPAAGSYEFRLFASNGATRLATSATLTVTSSTLSAGSSTAAPGAVVNALLADGPGNATDWIALAAVGSGNTTYFDWRYLNGTQTAPGSGLTAATVPFTMPATPGSYEFRLFASNGFARLAASGPVTVTVPRAE